MAGRSAKRGVCVEKTSNRDAAIERPGLTPALDYLRAGDILAVCKLDRRGRRAAIPCLPTKCDCTTPPARRASHAVRDPASKAPGLAAPAGIASALHYTADSPARAARTDLDTVATAGKARRLYVTTRSLPAHYDVPRPMPMRPATGSPTLSPSTRTPPIVLSGVALGR